MSIKTKQEILIHIQKRYKAAKFHSKSKILDEFVASITYYMVCCKPNLL